MDIKGKNKNTTRELEENKGSEYARRAWYYLPKKAALAKGGEAGIGLKFDLRAMGGELGDVAALTGRKSSALGPGQRRSWPKKEESLSPRRPIVEGGTSENGQHQLLSKEPLNC